MRVIQRFNIFENTLSRPELSAYAIPHTSHYSPVTSVSGCDKPLT
jgi:hypothetical protein